jgi:hypothetical protein
MATRPELYREKAEMCRRRAELVRNDLSEASRWRKLAEQWLNMADEADKVARPLHSSRRRSAVRAQASVGHHLNAPSAADSATVRWS